MEPNLFAALPQAVQVNDQTLKQWPHHQRALSDNPFCIADDFDMDMLDEVLNFDISKLPNIDSTNFIFPPPPPTTIETSVNSGPVSTEAIDCGRIGGVEGAEHHHRRNVSVDILSTATFQGVSSSARSRVATAERFTAITSTDLKKARRNLNNRRNALIMKERKKQHLNQLEKQSKELEIQSKNLLARISQLKKETADLATRDKERKIELEGMRKTSQVQSVLSQKINEELHYLRVQINQNAAILNNYYSYNGMTSQFSSQLALNQVPHPPPQFQIPHQPQLFMPVPPPPPSGLPFGDEFGPNYFSNYNEELAYYSNTK